MADRAKSVMGADKVKGEGTRVSEYVESKFPRECHSCEYFQDPNLCGHKVVMADKQIKTDKKTGLKIVDPEYGCCRFWCPDHHDLDIGVYNSQEVNKETIKKDKD